jgi:hypothetical protein
MQKTAEKSVLKKLIIECIRVANSFKERKWYDQMSMSLIKLGCFEPLIDFLLHEITHAKTTLGEIASILELCACQPSGITVLEKRLDEVVSACGLFLRRSNDLLSVKYPGTTLLLDLTANEQIF